MSPVLVGRERERAALAAALTAARSGAAVVLVGGEAGMGKTRLVREFTGGLGASVRVLTGGCTDLGVDGLPFGPFVTALRRLVRELDAPPVTALLPSGGRRGLARLLPELGVADDEPEPDLGRARLFEEVLLLLEGAARQRSLVLVLEDLHWADRSTGELLTFLATNLGEPGVLIIGTYRPDEIGGTHPLRPLVSRVDSVRGISLGGLDRDGVAEQLGGLLAAPADEAFTERVFLRSGGNPLFVEALVTVGDAPAASLSDLLLADVDRLPDPSRRVLHTAAVAASPVGHALLAILVEMDDLAFEDALRPLVRRRFLDVVEDGYAFRRDLIREAVYGSLLPGERVRLHRACAEAITTDPALVSGDRAYAEVALHWHASGAPIRAAEAAWHAAESARRTYAYAEQHRLLDRVLRTWQRVPDLADRLGVDRGTVASLAAEAALNAGELDTGVASVTTALAEHPDPEVAALLLRTRAAMYDRNGQDPMPDLHEAVRLLPTGADTPLRGEVLADLAIAQRHHQHDAEARTTAEDALRIGRRTGDRGVQARALITLAAADADLPTAVELFERARTAARDAGAADTQLAVAVTESDRLEAAGEHARAEQVARSGITLARELGLTRTRGTLLAPNLSESLLSLGRWDEAEAVYREALAQSPPPLYRAYLQVIQATVDLRRGALDAATTAATQARAVMREPNRGEETCLEPDLLDCRLAQIRQDAGAVTAILDHVLTDHDLARSPRYSWPLLTTGALTLVGHHGTGALLTRMSTYADTLAVTGRLQQAHRLTFLAATRHDDTDAWAAAIEAWRDLGQPYPLAEALLHSTRAALATQHRSTAAELITEAASIAEGLGAAPLHREIQQLATRARITTNPTRPGNPAGLTTREMEVLELVVAGLSNRKIGEHLFISAKTAGVHVSNILAKLTVTTRLEAAAWAHRNQLFKTEINATDTALGCA
ncbi:LuxR family transcriptional regulator [Streptosporangium sp. KLBMP 9127]